MHSLIIGATSSLAYSVSHQLAKDGHNLTLIARNKTELELMQQDIIIRHNVQVDIIIQDIEGKDFNPKDYLTIAQNIDDAYVFIGDMGTGEKNDINEISHIIEVNFLLLAQIISQVADVFQQRNYGNIIVISSVAGERGRQSNYIYGSAKAGLTCFTDGIRNYLSAQKGNKVHIMTVKAGLIDTPLVYGDGGKSKLLACRESVARKIITSLRHKRNIVYIPYSWRYIMFIVRSVPDFVFKKLKL